MKSLILPGLIVAAASALAQDIQFHVPGDNSNGSPSADASAAQPPAPGKFTNEQLTEEFGWWIAKRLALTEVQFTPAEREALLKGFSSALQGHEAPYDLEKAGPQMDAFMNGKQTSAMAQMKDKNEAAAQAFFTKLHDNKNVVFLPDGLAYEIVQPGEGPYPAPTDTVKVNYTGRLLNGTVFDSSVQRGTPAEFPLNGVIPGWTEGIQKINKGGKIRLYIPSNLAYGDNGNQGIPPASALIFDVDLLDFKPSAPSTPAHP